MTKLVCIDCMSPNALKDLLAAEGTAGQCFFCHGQNLCITTRALYDYLWDRIRENIVFIDKLSDYEQAMIYECGSDDIQIATIDVVLSEWLGLGEDPYIDDAIENLPDDLRQDEYGNQRHFFMDEGNLERNPYDDKWVAFVRGITHVHRFFNSGASAFLDKIFADLVDVKGSIATSRLLVLQPGVALYRARKVDGLESAQKLAGNPGAEFGPTPPWLAGNQRMTPSGISALYCALDRDTCLSEIRSITGDNVVSVALSPINSMIFLDISRLADGQTADLSMLQEGYLDQVHRRSFIRSLVSKMSRPKRTGDELTYLSTQVVFEYLRMKIGETAQGIAFPSVQTGRKGVNIAVFPEYCLIASSISADTDNSISQGSAFLSVVPDSAVFHKITAISTSATTYLSANHLFMDEPTKRRFGDHGTESWREADRRMQYMETGGVSVTPKTGRVNRFMRQRLG